MRRESKPASFAEALVVGGGNRRLEAIEELLDWAAVERLLKPVYAAATGRASYPVLSLLRRCCWERGMGWATRNWRRRWATGCRSAALPGWGWTRRSRIIRRCGAFATNCASSAWPRRALPRSPGSWRRRGWW